MSKISDHRFVASMMHPEVCWHLRSDLNMRAGQQRYCLAPRADHEQGEALSQAQPHEVGSPERASSPPALPYKCPCCDGWGRRPNWRAVGTAADESIYCNACSGTGVLWR